MEEQKRVHKAKEDARLENQFIEMCIQESLAEGERLATSSATASIAENDDFVKERERLRALAFSKYGPSDMDTSDSIVTDIVTDTDTPTSNEEKGEQLSQSQTQTPPSTQTQTQKVSLDSLLAHDEPVVPPAKLMARFVRDVTMPDGSEIAPYSTFFKTWRVRNDGQGAWPEGCHLVSAGGDRLCDSKLGDDFVIREPVPATPAGEEVELTLELCAPSATGRHVGYFRLEKPDGGLFGQRLWSDIRVSDTDMSVSMTLSPWEVIDSASEDGQQDENSCEKEEGTTSADEVAVSSDDERKQEQELYTSEAGRERLLEETEVLEVESEHANQLIKEFDAEVALWSKELTVLSAMGFNDLQRLLPLLQAHVEVPLSKQEENGVTTPSSEAGLQAVVLALLSGQE
jgi:hypothetical protein